MSDAPLKRLFARAMLNVRESGAAKEKSHIVPLDYDLGNGWTATKAVYTDAIRQEVFPGVFTAHEFPVTVHLESSSAETMAQIPAGHLGFPKGNPALDTAHESRVDYLSATVNAKVAGHKLDRYAHENAMKAIAPKRGIK
jgi:hypothetical protein